MGWLWLLGWTCDCKITFHNSVVDKAKRTRSWIEEGRLVTVGGFGGRLMRETSGSSCLRHLGLVPFSVGFGKTIHNLGGEDLVGDGDPLLIPSGAA